MTNVYEELYKSTLVRLQSAVKAMEHYERSAVENTHNPHFQENRYVDFAQGRAYGLSQGIGELNAAIQHIEIMKKYLLPKEGETKAEEPPTEEPQIPFTVEVLRVPHDTNRPSEIRLRFPSGYVFTIEAETVAGECPHLQGDLMDANGKEVAYLDHEGLYGYGGRGRL